MNDMSSPFFPVELSEERISLTCSWEERFEGQAARGCSGGDGKRPPASNPCPGRVRASNGCVCRSPGHKRPSARRRVRPWGDWPHPRAWDQPTPSLNKAVAVLPD